MDCQEITITILLFDIFIERMSELRYKETTEKIIGSAMRVHAAMGNGFQEVIYQRCLAIEFTDIKLPFERV